MGLSAAEACSLAGFDGLSGGDAASADAAIGPVLGDGGSDASARGPDARPATLFCDDHPQAVYCNDFDRGALSTSGWFMENTGSVSLVQDDARSAPSALLTNIGPSPTPSTAGLVKPLAGTFSTLSVAWSLRLSVTGEDVASLARIRLGARRIQLVAEADAFHTQEVVENDGGPSHVTNRPAFASALAPTWTRVGILIDIPGKRSVLTIDGKEAENVALASDWTPGSGYVELGLTFAAFATGTIEARLDDVLVTSP